MRTLVISDLHLGSRVRRDVLRRPAALARLCDALHATDRLVLLGDTVELLEGRPRRALADAVPVLRAIGAALGPGRDVILLPGNHDHALVGPWLRERRRAGAGLRRSGRVPLRSNPALKVIAAALRPARLEVRYPGADLGDGIWAHHGHYLDRHLVRRPQVGQRATPEQYERAIGTSIVQAGAVLAASLPAVVGAPLLGAAKVIGLADVLSRPLVTAIPGAGFRARLTAAALGWQFEQAGLPAMAAVAARLGVPQDRVVFGHLHRSGPRATDAPGPWQINGRRMWNTGSWVYEPLLLSGAAAPHPYWPGGALLIEDGAISALGLLDDLAPAELR